MLWLYIALSAHFLNAIVFTVDKYILSKTRLHPVSYAFYIGAFSPLSIVFFPFGFSLLTFNLTLLALVSGFVFVFAILFFYKSLETSEVSRIAPIIGSSVPIFTIAMSYIFLGERLASLQLAAFALLVVGGFILLWPHKSVRKDSRQLSLKKRLPIAILAGFFFALSYVLRDFVYSQTNFFNGFIWAGFGAGLAAVLIFSLPFLRKQIYRTTDTIRPRTIGIAGINKVLSICSLLLLNYAFFLGSVSLINALQGFQYLFLLLFAVLISIKYPTIIKEHITRNVIFQKVFSIIIIVVGLVLLTR